MAVSQQLRQVAAALAQADIKTAKDTLQEARKLLAPLPALATVEGLTKQEWTALYLLRTLVNDIFFNLAMDSTVPLPQKGDPGYEPLMERLAEIARNLGCFLQDIMESRAVAQTLVSSIDSYLGLLVYIDKRAEGREGSE